MKQGLTHIYCGDGKGKTTASLGLAIRCAGNGGRVLLVQFLKGSHTSELAVLENIDNITVIRNTQDFGFSFAMTEEEKQQIRQMHNAHLQQAIEQCQRETVDLLILDECFGALHTGLLDASLLRELVFHKPESLELVLTGRNPPADLMQAADYVSEIRKIKHPYDRGISARPGIEK